RSPLLLDGAGREAEDCSLRPALLYQAGRLGRRGRRSEWPRDPTHTDAHPPGAAAWRDRRLGRSRGLWVLHGSARPVGRCGVCRRPARESPNFWARWICGATSTRYSWKWRRPRPVDDPWRIVPCTPPRSQSSMVELLVAQELRLSSGALTSDFPKCTTK